MKTLVKVLLLFVLFSPSLFAQGITGGGAGGAGNSISYAWYLSRSCPIGVTNCTVVKANGHYQIDMTSNSTTTITCPNNDCNFTSNDAFGNPVARVGQKFWATTQGSTPGQGYLIYTTYVCPVTTIATVAAQTLTLNAACTANGTANVVGYWGDDDGAVLNALDSTVACATVYLPDPGPNGLMMFTSRGFFRTAPTSGAGNASTCNQSVTSSVGAPGPALIGPGGNASQAIIMLTPDFTWSDAVACSGASQNVAIGCTLRTAMNIQFLGSGLTNATNSNCSSNATNKIVFSTSPLSSEMIGIDMAGICPGTTGLEGIEINSYDESLDYGGVQSTGQYACVFYNVAATLTRGNDCHNFKVSGAYGLWIKGSGSKVVDTGSLPLAVVLIDAGATLNSYGANFWSNDNADTILTVNGTWIDYGGYVGVAGTTPGTAVSVGNGGKVQIANTTIKASNTSIANCAGCTGANSASVISLGGNTLQALVSGSTALGQWSGDGVVGGGCRGTATSSATLGLYGFGQWATQNCTSTVVNLGVPILQVPSTGSVFGLVVNAGTGCKSGNTCVFTVLKNNSSTVTSGPITCSMTGGAATCADLTHYDIPTAGDVYSIQFTTGGTETLANVRATLLFGLGSN